MIGIGDMYRCAHRINSYGIEGYQVDPKYQAPLKDKNKDQKEEKRKPTKRGHYLEDYAKIHGEIPGPNVYDYETDPMGKVEKPKKKIKPSKKQTFIEQLMEKQRKYNLPAPGQYQLFKTEAEIKAERKRLAHRKISVADRCTYLDAVQYEATTTPGVGSYNPTSVRPKSATLLRNKSNPLVRPMSTKRKSRQAEVGSYNPKEVEDHKSFAKKSKGYHEWGRVERFKSDKKGNALGPGAYAMDERMVARKNAKSVYYG